MEATTSQTIANVVVALAPAFAAGFAVQQGLQIVDPLVEVVNPSTNNKRAVMGILSLILGLVVAYLGQLHILAALTTATGSSTSGFASQRIDTFVSALFISGGTEGFNSVMKFLSYQKEGAKADAAKKQSQAATVPPPTDAAKAAALGNI